MSIFELDKKDFKRLRKFYKESPRQFSRATALLLNGFAAGTRKQAILEIQNKMTVRDEKFLKRALRFKTARLGPIDGQFSEAGSVSFPRFSGWAEQELGDKLENTRSGSFRARTGNNVSGKMRANARLKPGNDFEILNTTEQSRVMAFLRERKIDKKPFIVKKKFKRMRPGVYRLRVKKMDKLQSFKRRKPKRIPWLTDARRKHFASTSLVRAWEEALRPVLKF